MTDKLHHTKGIVLRTVKYAETSVVVTIYTELFGIQTYLVNGVRTHSKTSAGKAAQLQPAAILDLIVYHNDLKNLQRIKEIKWAHLYTSLFNNVLKNAVALFMVELLQKTIKQPEQNADLFYFIEDSFLHLDNCQADITGNYPLFFALHLSGFFGFRLSDEYNETLPVLDLQEGVFVTDHPHHTYYLDPPYSIITSELLKTQQPADLQEIKLNHQTRRILLNAYQTFYALHVPDFGTMKTLPVLQAVFS
ncbi:MAG: repair protein RecO [Bacteroidota bacterium]|jgi:DNA repair protein RecO (recombination protein O)